MGKQQNKTPGANMKGQREADEKMKALASARAQGKGLTEDEKAVRAEEKAKRDAASRVDNLVRQTEKNLTLSLSCGMPERILDRLTAYLQFPREDRGLEVKARVMMKKACYDQVEDVLTDPDATMEMLQGLLPLLQKCSLGGDLLVHIRVNRRLKAMMDAAAIEQAERTKAIEAERMVEAARFKKQMERATKLDQATEREVEQALELVGGSFFRALD